MTTYDMTDFAAQVQRLAGYPLTGCPSAVQFLELLYNGMVRGV